MYLKRLGRFFRFLKNKNPAINTTAKITQNVPKAKVEINKAAAKKPNKRYTKCKPSLYKGKTKAA